MIYVKFPKDYIVVGEYLVEKRKYPYGEHSYFHSKDNKMYNLWNFNDWPAFYLLWYNIKYLK